MGSRHVTRNVDIRQCPVPMCGGQHEVAALLLGTPILVCPESRPERAMFWYDGLIVVGGRKVKSPAG